MKPLYRSEKHFLLGCIQALQQMPLRKYVESSETDPLRLDSLRRTGRISLEHEHASAIARESHGPETEQWRALCQFHARLGCSMQRLKLLRSHARGEVVASHDRTCRSCRGGLEHLPFQRKFSMRSRISALYIHPAGAPIPTQLASGRRASPQISSALRVRTDGERVVVQGTFFGAGQVFGRKR